MPRSSRFARTAALTVAAVSLSLAGTHGVSARAADPAPPTEQDVAALQHQVDALGDELSAATQAYEEKQVALDQALQNDYNAQTANEDATNRVQTAQAALDASVSLAFRNPGGSDLFVLVAKGQQAYDDKRAIDKALGRTAEAQREAVDELVEAKAAAQSGADARRALTLQAQQQQKDVDAALAALQDRAAAGQAELEKAATALEAEQARQAAAAAAAAAAASNTLLDQTSSIPAADGGATCQSDPTGLVVNGFLPAANLCFLRTAPGHRLRPSAAAAFDAMSDAYAKATGSPICVTDSYRTYAQQVDVFRRKPSLAATPGKSNHGLGLAVDLCGGVQVFNSPAHNWLLANSQRFGFTHPDWAEPDGSKPEAWHWEYHGPGSK